MKRRLKWLNDNAMVVASGFIVVTIALGFVLAYK